MTPLPWTIWLATLPPRAPSLNQPARRPPDDAANMIDRWERRTTWQIRRRNEDPPWPGQEPPPDIVRDDTD